MVFIHLSANTVCIINTQAPASVMCVTSIKNPSSWSGQHEFWLMVRLNLVASVF